MTSDESTPSIFGARVNAPGESLREGRERAGLTQEDIAGKLKLAPRQIAAIESGDWAALPERTFTRGFMRNYARLVGIDPDSLGLDQSQSQPNAANQLKPTPEAIGEIAREIDRNGFSAARWVVPVLLIAALAVGVLYFQGGRWFGWDTSKILSTSAPTAKSAVANNAGLAVEKAAAPAASSTAPTSAANASATSSGAVIAPANASATVVSENATTGLIPVAPTVVAATLPSAAGDKRITITFKGKSWTEVRSKGNVIFSETATPGVREFAGSPPLSFTVGNATNVIVSIDGKPFDMAELTRNDVARFRIE